MTGCREGLILRRRFIHRAYTNRMARRATTHILQDAGSPKPRTRGIEVLASRTSMGGRRSRDGPGTVFGHPPSKSSKRRLRCHGTRGLLGDSSALVWRGRYTHASHHLTPRTITPAMHRGYSVSNPNKALWEKGDFTRIAACMRGSGEAVIASLAVTPSMRATRGRRRSGSRGLRSARATPATCRASRTARSTWC
jgi:hypothetical protein